MSKTFSLTIPRLTSITKSDVSPKSVHKRATGKVLMVRPSAKKAVASSRSRFRSAGWVSWASAGGVAVLAFSFGFYVYMINAYASKGYELKKQQAVMQELQETHKRLVIEQAASGSIVKINDVASAARMVPVTGEEFLVANQVSSR
jgi:hypothetical protein